MSKRVELGWVWESFQYADGSVRMTWLWVYRDTSGELRYALAAPTAEERAKSV